MILEQVLHRKLQAISMDDTLAVAARKLRDLDRVDSPIITLSDDQRFDDPVQIMKLDGYPELWRHRQDQDALT